MITYEKKPKNSNYNLGKIKLKKCNLPYFLIYPILKLLFTNA